MASSCVISQYFSTPGFTASFVCGYPLIIYLLSICNFTYSSVVGLMSSIDMHIGTPTVLFMVCILMFICDISWSLFSMWLWLMTQFVQNTCNVLVYVQHDVLQPLSQCCNIFSDLGHKQLVICDDIYFLCKAIVMTFFKYTHYTQHFSFSVAVLPLHAAYWQKQFGGRLYYLELHHTHSLCPSHLQ